MDRENSKLSFKSIRKRSKRLLTNFQQRLKLDIKVKLAVTTNSPKVHLKFRFLNVDSVLSLLKMQIQNIGKNATGGLLVKSLILL